MRSCREGQHLAEARAPGRCLPQGRRSALPAPALPRQRFLGAPLPHDTALLAVHVVHHGAHLNGLSPLTLAHFELPEMPLPPPAAQHVRRCRRGSAAQAPAVLQRQAALRQQRLHSWLFGLLDAAFGLCSSPPGLPPAASSCSAKTAQTGQWGDRELGQSAGRRSTTGGCVSNSRKLVIFLHDTRGAPCTAFALASCVIQTQTLICSSQRCLIRPLPRFAFARPARERAHVGGPSPAGLLAWIMRIQCCAANGLPRAAPAPCCRHSSQLWPLLAC